MKKIFIAIATMVMLLSGCEPSAPATSNKVQTLDVSDVKVHSAIFHGVVNVDISNYKSVEFGVMISESKTELNNRDGKMIYADVLLGKNFKIETNHLSPATHYYYCAWLFLDKTQFEFGEIKEFTTEPEWVDLGLSAKWATCNVGASVPEEYGYYFAWGEVLPKDTYNWDNYKFCEGNDSTLTKYCTLNDFGIVDNKEFLEPTDDAATIHWGNEWRIPTNVEWTELRTKCTWTWTTQNEVNGWTIKGKNGNSIFLPASGYRYGNEVRFEGSYGCYWSKSINKEKPTQAYYTFFSEGYSDLSVHGRCCGQSIRHVCD